LSVCHRTCWDNVGDVLSVVVVLFVVTLVVVVAAVVVLAVHVTGHAVDFAGAVMETFFLVMCEYSTFRME